MSKFLKVLGILGLAMLWAAPTAVRAEKITFNLDWVPYGKHSGFYAAVEKGLYKAEGLDVNIVRGHGSSDTVKRIGANSAEFGHADAGNLVAGRGNSDIKVKMVAMIHHKSLFVMYALKSSGIKTPADLPGRSIGSSVGNATRIMMPALAGIMKWDINKVKWVDMQNSSQLPSVIAGRVDATVTYATIGPSYFAAGKKAGKEVVEALFADYGLDLYSNGIITQESRLTKNPNQVKRFVRASLKGLAYGVEHPDEAMKTFIKKVPSVSATLARAHLNINNRHLVTAETKKTGIGVMLKERMQVLLDTTTKYVPMKRKPALNEIYTNDYITVKLKPKMGSM
jgi:NitT/TauT family transport system substrate-binding protein